MTFTSAKSSLPLLLLFSAFGTGCIQPTTGVQNASKSGVNSNPIITTGGHPIIPIGPTSTPRPTVTPTSHPTSTPTPTPTSNPITGQNIMNVIVGRPNGQATPLPPSGATACDGYPDEICATITICTPGTTPSTVPSSCQTINNLLLDTGSYGLRIFSDLISSNVQLQQIPATNGGALVNCTQYGDGSSDWGPVKRATVFLAGEPGVPVPVQMINAGFSTIPVDSNNASLCPDADISPTQASTNPHASGFNGILGVGLFTQDCGPSCAQFPDIGAYFSCNGTGPNACIGTTVPTGNQVQNPVALLPYDNNGVILTLPSVSVATGALSVTGTLILGIGTQPNNAPKTVTTFPVSTAPNNSFGTFTALFNGLSYLSFIDSGSSIYFFPGPSTLPQCMDLGCCSNPNTGQTVACPANPSTSSIVNGCPYCPLNDTCFGSINNGVCVAGSVLFNQGSTGSPTKATAIEVSNYNNLTNSSNNAFMNIGSPSSEFDYGLPFFFGKSIYVGIAPDPNLPKPINPSPLGTGPYWAY